MFDTTIILTLVSVFACVLVIAAGLTSTLLEHRSTERRRLQQLLQPSAKAVTAGGSLFLGNPADGPAKKIVAYLPKSPKEMGRLQRRLVTAGYHHRHAITWYVLSEIVIGAAAFLAILWLAGPTRGLILAILGGIAGYMVPSFAVALRMRKRQKQIQNGLADALDLLIVCLEAGMAIDQAIVKSSDELAIPYPALAEELRIINVECRAGKPRMEAFKNFAARTRLEDVRALVGMLIQTDRFGTSVAQALRTFAEVARTKRRQRAEERAAKIGVKLVFPLVFCLFPGFYVVTLGPAVVKFVHALAPGGALSGGM